MYIVCRMCVCVCVYASLLSQLAATDKENKTVAFQIGKEERFMSALVILLFDYDVCIVNYRYILYYIYKPYKDLYIDCLAIITDSI